MANQSVDLCPHNPSDLGSPLDYGWQRDDSGLSPVYFEGPIAAEIIADLVCSCITTNICGAGCVCQQSGLPCTDLCTCEADTECCGNAVTPLDEDE